MTSSNYSASIGKRRRGFRGLLALAMIGAFWNSQTNVAFAQVPGNLNRQNPYYQPVNQNLPTGVAAYWAGALGKATPPYFQPVRVNVPSQGKVTVYHGPGHTPFELDTKQPFAILVGHVYRFKVSGMPEYPGVELYPSVELLDRLHPPPGEELNFPVPLEFTETEIAAALDGRLVTKVIFLEQPNLAPPREQTSPIPTPDYPSSVNILAEADQVGRPMAILRLGSRVPWAGGADAGFFGPGTPVYIPKANEQVTEPTPTGQPETRPSAGTR